MGDVGLLSLYLVSNPWPVYGHGNTWLSSLANVRASHRTIFVCWSPLQCEAPAKPINFHVFDKKFASFGLIPSHV